MPKDLPSEFVDCAVLSAMDGLQVPFPSVGKCKPLMLPFFSLGAFYIYVSLQIYLSKYITT